MDKGINKKKKSETPRSVLHWDSTVGWDTGMGWLLYKLSFKLEKSVPLLSKKSDSEWIRSGTSVFFLQRLEH